MTDSIDPPRPPDDETVPVDSGEPHRPARQQLAATPARIGPYRLLGMLGSGGMGDVYLAQQDHPVRRKVAIKLIKAGLDTLDLTARFESERQALALLNHRNVAQIYEASSTEAGRPYFVMEYVPGLPITRYAQEKRLTLESKVLLFLEVCAGVQHAHQRGLIHRDLKPSNILVTEESGCSIPKIIDFGIAKATGRVSLHETAFTSVGQLVGTPGYMSPEQAQFRAVDVDTRSDVYSLGGVLYELLTGIPIVDPGILRAQGLEAYLRHMREVEPLRPSDVVLSDRSGSASARQRADAAVRTLSRLLRDDLDWVVMKALEKDVERRYQSVTEFADDLRRHLALEPVSAGPPGARYRMGKFIRKHRAGVAAAGATLAVFVLGIAGTTIGFVQAKRAERSAREEALTTRQVTSFMIDLFRVSDPGTARGNSITAREVLDAGSRRINRELSGQPSVRARMMEAMGEVYRNLGLLEESEPLLEAAYSDRRRRWHGDHPELASSLQSIGHLRLNQGRFQEAKEKFRQAYDMRTRVLPAGDVDLGWSEYWLAAAESFTGNLEDALPRMGRALKIFRSTVGYESQPSAWCVNDIGMIHLLRGNYAAAAGQFEEAARIKERILGPDHPDLAVSLSSAGYAHTKLLNPVRALPILDRAYAIAERALGPRHSSTAGILQCRGEAFRIQGNLEAASRDLGRALDIQQSVYPATHPEVILTIRSLSALHSDRGDHETALRYLDRAIAALSTPEGGRGEPLVECLGERSRILDAMGRSDEADKARRQAESVGEREKGQKRAIGYVP